MKRVESIEELLPKAGGSVYRLVRMASNRALELADGKKSLVDSLFGTKVTTTALDEIAQGAIVYKKSKNELVESVEEASEEVEEILH